MTSQQPRDEGSRPPTRTRRKKEIKKEEEEDEIDEEVYCFCRQVPGYRYMICCDSCNEWYHGDCVGITDIDGKLIDIYYCLKCTTEYPNLKTVYFPNKKMTIDANEVPNTFPERCNECINCMTTEDCGNCPRCISKTGRCLLVLCLNGEQKPDKEEMDRRKAPTLSPLPSSPVSSDDEDEDGDEAFCLPASGRAAGGGGVAGSSKRFRGKKTKKQLEEENETEAEWWERAREVWVPDLDPLQCLGRGCVNAATDNSKYCSKECGMDRAMERLHLYLPNAAGNFWQVDPVAVRLAREREARNKQQLDELHKEKAELDGWHDLTLRYVDTMKQFPPEEEEDVKPMKKMAVVCCPVCTHNYGNKVIAKHIEVCYARSERKMTYGAATKYDINPHNIFCEQFNKSDSSYCKRIRVLCPDHYKGDIEEGLQVCGYPMVWKFEGAVTLNQLFKSVEVMIGGGACYKSRKACKQHCGWITTILGLLDSRRVAYFQAVEEIYEKKRENPGDALLLMSNQTVYHQPLEPMLEEYENGEGAGLAGQLSESTLGG